MSGPSFITRFSFYEMYLLTQHQVYDVSAFLAEHPGGAAILEENSGVELLVFMPQTSLVR